MVAIRHQNNIDSTILGVSDNKNNADIEFNSPFPFLETSSATNTSPIFPYAGSTRDFFVSVMQNAQLVGEQVAGLVRNGGDVGSTISVGAGLLGLFTTDDNFGTWDGATDDMTFRMVGTTGDGFAFRHCVGTRFFFG